MWYVYMATEVDINRSSVDKENPMLRDAVQQTDARIQLGHGVS